MSSTTMTAESSTRYGEYHHRKDSSTFPYLLPHREVNIKGSCTIILVHCGSGSHHEYRGVLDSGKLSAYHLILPDLHSDGIDASRGIEPFEMSRVAALIAHLIRTKSKDGRGHLAGVSLGAHAVIATVVELPSIVSSAFVSGYNRFSPSPRAEPILSAGFYCLMKIQGLWPTETSAIKAGETDDEGDQPPTIISTADHQRHIQGTIVGGWNAGDRMLTSQGVEPRVCVICARKFPSGDMVSEHDLLEKRAKAFS